MEILSEPLFPGFTVAKVPTTGGTIHTVSAGSGPGLLLWHGAPQTHATWHKIAPRLAEHYTVVAADLRGYGDSSKPEGGPNHINYSKRAMALDGVGVMRHFGFEKLAVVGHDRGGASRTDWPWTIPISSPRSWSSISCRPTSCTTVSPRNSPRITSTGSF